MLRIHFFDVGLGDSIVLEKTSEGNKRFFSLIDCKTHESHNPTKHFLVTNKVKEIDSLLITHYHDDHTSGVIDLLNFIRDNKIKLGKIICPNSPARAIDWYHKTLKDYEKSINEIKEEHQKCKKMKSLRAQKAQLRRLKSREEELQKIYFKQFPKETLLPLLGAIKDAVNLDSFVPGQKCVIEYSPLPSRVWLEDFLLRGTKTLALSPSSQMLNDDFSKMINGSPQINNDIINKLSQVILIADPDDSNASFLATGDMDNEKRWKEIKNEVLAFVGQKPLIIKSIKLPHHGTSCPELVSVINSFRSNSIVDIDNMLIPISCPGSKSHPDLLFLQNLSSNFPKSVLSCTRTNRFCESLSNNPSLMLFGKKNDRLLYEATAGRAEAPGKPCHGDFSYTLQGLTSSATVNCIMKN